MSTFTTPQGKVLPLLLLKGKEYLQVAHRLVWFREEHPDWTIETGFIEYDDKHAVAKAKITDQTGRLIATSHKVEDKTGFGDFMEKAETGAIGRALALCGYGTQFTDDFEETPRIVDSPVTRPQVAAKSQTFNPLHGKAPALPLGSPNYVCQTGKKHLGKQLCQMSIDEIEGYRDWAMADSKKTGNPISQPMQTWIDNANAYVKKFQGLGNQPYSQVPPDPTDDIPF